jgi:hypothetical protein
VLLTHPSIELGRARVGRVMNAVRERDRQRDPHRRDLPRAQGQVPLVECRLIAAR